MAPKKGSIPWNKGKKNCQRHYIADITGQVFGRLTAIKLHEIKNRRSYWMCDCECGNDKVAYLWDLKSNRTQSCGCLNTETTVKHNKEMSGKDSPAYKHGRVGTKEYNNEVAAEYRAKKLNQTPELTENEKDKIELYYKISQYLGKDWHVDHIHPIAKGGLHHPNNLQILTKNANHRKIDKLDFIPDPLECFKI